MKRRRVPNTISKRMRRKLRRAKNPFLLWLQCKRPAVYARLLGWWYYQFLNAITDIAPIDTPFPSMAPRVTARELIHTWVTDKLIPVEGQ